MDQIHLQLEQAIAQRQSLEIDYTNWRGERALRRVLPLRLYQGESQWHPGLQALLDAVDLDKQAERSFAVDDIHALDPLPTDSSP